MASSSPLHLCAATLPSYPVPLALATFLLVVLSALLHAGWNVIAKRHSGNYSIIYLSFCIGFVLCVPFAYPHISTTVNWAEVLPWVILTGVFHSVYGLLLSFTYKHGDISTLYPIVRGSGIIGAVVLGSVLLSETLPWPARIGTGAVILGIAILSYRRNRKATPAKGIALALLSGTFIMTYTVLDKVLVDSIHPLVLMASSQLISAITFLPYVVLKRRSEMLHTVRHLWKPTMAIAVLALVSYLIILHVFRVAPLSRIVAIRELSVVFGAITGYIWLNENFSRLRLIGVITVVLGIILVKQL